MIRFRGLGLFRPLFWHAIPVVGIFCVAVARQAFKVDKTGLFWASNLFIQLCFLLAGAAFAASRICVLEMIITSFE